MRMLGLYSLLVMTMLFASLSGHPVHRKVHLSYPVELMTPSVGSYFESKLMNDRLTCFSNRDFGMVTYKEAFACLLMLPVGTDCLSLWGSRLINIEANGSVEIFKMLKLPQENTNNEIIYLNATRWLEMNSLTTSTSHRESKIVPAEPIYLCARSNHWTRESSHFRISFSTSHLRLQDRNLYGMRLFIHLVLALISSSVWFIPYLGALCVAVLAYGYSIHYFILISVVSCAILSIAPLILITRRHRHLTKLYFKYFFTRYQVEETRHVIRQRMPLFQALFFSSGLIMAGSMLSYGVYCTGLISRETRNAMMQTTISIGAGWLTFFLCRSFERFCRDWLWMGMAVVLAQLMDHHLNPMCRDEVIVLTIVLSYVVKTVCVKIGDSRRVKKHVLRLAWPHCQTVGRWLGVRDVAVFPRIALLVQAVRAACEEDLADLASATDAGADKHVLQPAPVVQSSSFSLSSPANAAAKSHRHTHHNHSNNVRSKEMSNSSSDQAGASLSVSINGTSVQLPRPRGIYTDESSCQWECSVVPAPSVRVTREVSFPCTRQATKFVDIAETDAEDDRLVLRQQGWFVLAELTCSARSHSVQQARVELDRRIQALLSQHRHCTNVEGSCSQIQQQHSRCNVEVCTIMQHCDCLLVTGRLSATVMIQEFRCNAATLAVNLKSMLKETHQFSAVSLPNHVEVDAAGEGGDGCSGVIDCTRHRTLLQCIGQVCAGRCDVLELVPLLHDIHVCFAHDNDTDLAEDSCSAAGDADWCSFEMMMPQEGFNNCTQSNQEIKSHTVCAELAVLVALAVLVSASARTHADER